MKTMSNKGEIDADTSFKARIDLYYEMFSIKDRHAPHSPSILLSQRAATVQESAGARNGGGMTIVTQPASEESNTSSPK